ncbi:MAG TPA: tripartite tricarboxylate transporter TctB family protein [Usitatibacteraceae bacterium]
MSDSDGKSAVSTKTIDLVVAMLFFLLGALVMYDSARLGSKWGSDGPEAGYFPFYIGLILCFGALVNALRASMGKDIKDESFVSVPALKMVLSVLLPTIVYVLFINGVGPIPALGIYVPSVAFIAVFMIWLGKYRWLKTLVISVSVVVVFFVMFEIWFKVPLPKGPLETALGFN